eukprot:CAMPEP_0179145824 /NCGR_PEP_ID=MMETSP0796-20121207/70382_1 /TAXON_ID=73915 /ORGANISM="Pyrodinium bahamense, Strain pbaha01" /LENGTH=363 /DNA_ID=CAMNT_0020846253 /DNA_START=92 /DNA_END=1183 /DNA_ORIENTATION=-
MAREHLSEAGLMEVDEDAQSTEELLPHRKESWCSRPHFASAGLAALAFVSCAALATLGLSRFRSSANALSAAKPVTVRELLEGPELTDVVTENFMSIGHGFLSPAQRGEVRAAVAENFANITGSLRQRFPEDHAKLGLIQLSQEQKSSVFGLLRHYSDPRVQRLGKDIAEAVAETRQRGGDSASLKRRLSDKLRPQLRELRELCDDIAPGSGKNVNLDVDDLDDPKPVQEFEGWHVEVDMTPPKVARNANNALSAGAAATSFGRRLTADDTLSGTREQASTVFEHLHGMLGKTMPDAPARMLLFEKQKEQEAKTTGWERFMNCVMDNFSSPSKMFTCLMTNCRRAMTWLMKKFHLDKMISSAM